jgi:hypothetical protein
MPAKLPPMRIDAVSLVVHGLEVVVFIGTLKVLAYRYHGNPFAQAFLVLF